MTFRSRQMSHYQLIIPREGAWQVANEIGQIQLAHLIDCGDPLHRPFFQQLKRCDQALQKIDFLAKGLQKAKIQIQQYDEDQPLFYEKLTEIWKQTASRQGLQQIRLIDKMETQVLEEWQNYQDVTMRLQKLTQGKRSILQKIACFEIANKILGEPAIKGMSQQYYINNIPSVNRQLSGVSFLVGVVPPSMKLRLDRMIYRVSRGYACVQTLQIFKYKGLKDFEEVVTLVMYPNSQTNILEKKLKRVMQTFCSNNFLLNSMQVNPRTQYEKLIQQYQEAMNLVELNQKQLKGFYERIRKISMLETWRLYFWKQRHLYSLLDKMEIREQFFRISFYVPTDQAAKLNIKLQKLRMAPSLHQLGINTPPPTAFRTNSYTAIAQQITNTYGTPRYQQVNPSIFTTVTFPFFFGVMFGDIAHGGFLLAVGIYLVLFTDKRSKGMMKMFAQLRYMILMMGFFAFYCGWIYNDFMAMNVNVFGSCYQAQPKYDQSDKSKLIQKHINPKSDCVYIFGIDPIWGRSQSNELVYVNALKMKISVIIAILHMTLGICIKAANALYMKNRLILWFEFVPQFIFFVFLFGYMDFLIVYKWLQPWQSMRKVPPSIITTMMNIGLQVGQTSLIQDGGQPMFGEMGNTIQDTIQVILLLLAVISVPWMLLPKPIIEISRMKKHKEMNPLYSQEQLENDLSGEKSLQQRLNPSEDHSEKHSLHSHKIITSKHQQDSGHEAPNQIFVHQLIETIQFVLGAVSNTASYLRLWALSLAHSQLAKVFFEKTLQMGYGPETVMAVPLMIVGFYLLCWITFGILMCMDTMQCFLHSLRLHWVEFQNKFYKGDGYKYVPFSFRNQIMENKSKSAL